MDTIFVSHAFWAPIADVLAIFFAPIADVLAVYWCVLAVLATFMAGIALGQRRGYARGLKDGNPFPRLRIGSPYWNWLAMVFAE